MTVPFAISADPILLSLQWDCLLSPLFVFDAFHRSKEPFAFFYTGPAFEAPGRFAVFALSPTYRLVHPQEDPRDPFLRLRLALSATSHPLPAFHGFCGGWVGFFSYDLIHRIERLSFRAPMEHSFPLFELTFYRETLLYDHDLAQWTARYLMEEEENHSSSAILRHLESRRKWVEEISKNAKPSPSSLPFLGSEEEAMGETIAGEEGTLSPRRDSLNVISTFSREGYEKAVRRALDYIAAGDIYQVNLSQRFSGRLLFSPEILALRLFLSPSPFRTYLRHDRRAILSTSPERFLRVVGREVETWPIKGTRPRGRTEEEDHRLRQELLDSAKEKAELVMITDLHRNDLGRVCQYGSVTVPTPRLVESFPTVHHTRSTVHGILQDDADLVDLLKATFPGGSVTGAPKIRACEIIEELEPVARGPYCGALGWISVQGEMDLSMAIRIVAIEEDRFAFHVGSGIVAESDPALEYEETLHKAKGIFHALRISEG